MLINTFDKKQREWEKEAKKEREAYQYIVSCIKQGLQDKILSEFKKKLELPEGCQLLINNSGYTYIRDHKHVYFIYHPQYKYAEVYKYDKFLRSQNQRKWKFWKHISCPIEFNNDYKGEPLFQHADNAILYNIFIRCNWKDMHQCTLVCKRWNNFIKTNRSIWNNYKDICELPMGIEPSFNGFKQFVYDIQNKDFLYFLAKCWIYKNNMKWKMGDLVFITPIRPKSPVQTFKRTLKKQKQDIILYHLMKPLNAKLHNYIVSDTKVAFGVCVKLQSTQHPLVYVNDNGNLKIANKCNMGEMTYWDTNKWILQNVPDYIDYKHFIVSKCY